MHPVDVRPVRTCSVCMSGTHNTHYLFKLKGTHAVTPACLRLRLRVAISTSAARRARPGREGGGRRKKEIGTAATAEGIAVRRRGYIREMFGVDTPSCDLMESRLGLHVKAATPSDPPSSFLVCLRGFAVDENTKRWEEKNDTESCLICCVYRRWMMDTITHL